MISQDDMMTFYIGDCELFLSFFDFLFPSNMQQQYK